MNRKLKNITSGLTGLWILTGCVLHGKPIEETMDLAKIVRQAISNGEKRVVLPKGRFLLNSCVQIHNTSNLIIEGQGDETILVTPYGKIPTTFHVLKSRGITFRKFAIDSDPLPFTQGTIISKNQETDGRISVKFKVHKGYPQLTDKFVKSRPMFYFFDQKTRTEKKQSSWFVQPIIREDDTHGKVRLSSALASKLQPGDFILLRRHGATAFVLFQSSDIRFEDVTVYSAGPALIVRYLDGDNYFRYRITPRPRPIGASQDRLLSSTADGFQSMNSPGSFTFENCDFGFTGDDCICFSSAGFPVVEVVSPTIVRVVTRLPEMLRTAAVMTRKGDLVRPLIYGSLKPRGDFPITSMVFDGPMTTPLPKEIFERYNRFNINKCPAMRLYTATVTLEQPPKSPIEFGDLLSLRAFVPKNITIRDSYFHDTRARGILLMHCSKGVVENNRIERTSLPAITVGTEIAKVWGLNGDWVSNLTIQNNKIKDVLYNLGCITPSYHQAAAILVTNRPSAYDVPLGTYPWGSHHQNIKIINNTIDGSDVAGILMNGVTGGIVSNNNIRNTNQRGGEKAGRNLGLTAPYAITIINSHDVKTSNNRVSKLGAHGKGDIANLGQYPKGKQ